MLVNLLERALLNRNINCKPDKIEKSPLLKQNCWEVIKCGLEAQGRNAARPGICPALIDTSVDGLNGGINGGRICWAISGTFCKKKIHGLFAKTQLSCRSCVFFKQVKEEEGIKNFHQDIKTAREHLEHSVNFI